MKPDELTTFLDGVFAYKIGDLLIHRATSMPAGEKEYKFFADGPLRLLVIERVLQQCDGGVQKHYVVRAVSSNGNMGTTIQMVEMELAPFPSEPAVK